ncbi:hypothetical protein [Streptomyces mirabilis]|uniref:hypothetical protein n=1 Tax=Streptomyces mirabilis TaxID=68239 RepID=UPI0022570402|nr:hypothetical protein [Streptomyces mirabilis]MCX4609465.1 hypothetical protein [Streptomyces mirabilis]
MVQENGQLVCRKCGGWFDQGAVPGRRVVAAGLIARRTSGRSLCLAITARGVTGHLRPAIMLAAAGGCR